MWCFVGLILRLARPDQVIIFTTQQKDAKRERSLPLTAVLFWSEELGIPSRRVGII